MLELTLGLLFGGGALWLWASSMRMREQALRACQAACRIQQVQLLDQMVALRGWRLSKAAAGALQVQRVYAFEYSADGVARCLGKAMFTAGHCDYVCFESPSGGPAIYHGRTLVQAGGGEAEVASPVAKRC